MAGLLDAFGDDNARFSLGLLAAAGPRFDGANEGQRLQEALGGFDAYKQKQAQAKMQQMRMEQMQAEQEQAKREREQRERISAGMVQFFKPGQAALAPLMGDASIGIQPSAGRAAVAPSFNSTGAAQFLADNGDVKGALDMMEKFRPAAVKLKNVEQMRDPNTGQLVNVALYENGETKVLPFGVKPDIQILGMGDRQQVVDKNAVQGGESFRMGQSPDSKASNAVAWANNSISRERLNMDKTKAAAETANGGYSSKPLPASALKMQNEAVDAIGTASGINAQLTKVAEQIKDGTLSFGPVSNAMSSARNSLGMSNEQSRNLASFKSTMEKLRNDSLRLNAGVQTDGDAQRAWNELFQNINDTDLVKQRLVEISAINKRAEELQRLKVDQIRGNYNAAPMDFKPLLNVPSAATGSTSKTVNFMDLK